MDTVEMSWFYWRNSSSAPSFLPFSVFSPTQSGYYEIPSHTQTERNGPNSPLNVKREGGREQES